MSNPPGLVSLAARIEQLLPLSNNVGISGNPDTHHFGYHMSPNWLLTDPRSDYGANDASLHGPLNYHFNMDYASAIDTAYNTQPTLIRTVSARMRAAIKARDRRLLHNGEWVIAEAAGTLDGNVTWARYTDTQRETFGEWDNSHLSHNHWSIYRKFCNNYAALQGIADVMAGIPPADEEDYMSFYPDKATFEKALADIVKKEVNKQLAVMTRMDSDAGSATNPVHRIQTIVEAVVKPAP